MRINHLLRILVLLPLLPAFFSCRSSTFFDYRTQAQAVPLATPAPEADAPLMADASSFLQAEEQGQDLPSAPHISFTPVPSPASASSSANFNRATVFPSIPTATKLDLDLKEKPLLKKAKALKAASAPARNPFNQGYLAAILVLATGVGLFLLGAMLPTIGTILVGYVLGGAVLLAGVAFLALTLMGFTVRIFG